MKPTQRDRPVISETVKRSFNYGKSSEPDMRDKKKIK